MLASLGVLDVSASRQMHFNSSMLAKAEVGGLSPSLAEAGEGNHLPGLGDLEGTSLLQGLTACKQNKQTNKCLRKILSNSIHDILPSNIV